MKIKAFILPVVLAIFLSAAVCFWLYEYHTFSVVPRIAGQDGRPQIDQSDGLAIAIEGRLEQFDGKPSLLKGRWPGFRGAYHNAVVSSDVPLAAQWPPEGLPKLWEVQLGQGYAAPAVYDGRVYLIDYDMDNQRDAIRCLSLDDGREIWQYSYPVKIKRNHGMSRTIPAVNDKYIVTIGPKCHVTCLDRVTGEFKWMIDLVAEYGTKEPLWYAGQCPLIVDDKAIIAPAGPEALMMAVDCETGKVIWTTPNPDGWKMTHCSIIPMQFAGEDFYVYPGSRGVAGVSAEDGSILWKTDKWYLRVNVPTPIDCGGGKIFLCAGYNKGSMMLQLEQKDGEIDPKVLFKLGAETFGSDQQTPIHYKGHIYGVRPDKQLVCMDTSGTIIWTSGSENTYGLGPYIIANQFIYILDDDSVLSLVEATPNQFNKLAQTKVLNGHESWGPPALVAGRLMVRDLTTMACLDVSAK
jgi:outer membrane protein assembly factor BamB